jgi:hypothetical protein
MNRSMRTKKDKDSAKQTGYASTRTMGSKCMGACWRPNARRQVTLMRQTLSLFGHEVGNHVRRRGKSGSNVAQLKMLAAEVDAQVNVA